MNKTPLIGIIAIGLLIGFTLFGCQKTKNEPVNNEKPKIYNETADAGMDIEAAVGKAQEEGKHVLLMFGGNWCVWCHRLHHLFETHEDVHESLKQNYVLVLIDVGKRDKNLDLNEKYGNPFQHGFPVLVVLDEEGNQLWTQETGSLEKPIQEGIEKGHDPEKVLAFLKKWAPSAS